MTVLVKRLKGRKNTTNIYVCVCVCLYLFCFRYPMKILDRSGSAYTKVAGVKLKEKQQDEYYKSDTRLAT